MLNRKTVVILGAGASFELGFPLGNELVSKIRDKLSKAVNSDSPASDSKLLDNAAASSAQGKNIIVQVARRISNGVLLSSSIDDFLEIHAGNDLLLRLGKAAIVRSIIQAEQNSPLYTDTASNRTIDWSSIQNTWLTKLFKILCRGLPTNDLQYVFDRIAFVTFNYDRSVEQFFRTALVDLYGASPEQVLSAMNCLRIYHAYGSIGPLTADGGREGGAIAFGGYINGEDWWALGENIHTYSERREQPRLQAQLAKELNEAERILFLGMAYHPQNMQLLTPKQPIMAKQIYATATGISAEDCAEVSRQLLQFVKPEDAGIMVSQALLRVRNDLTCAKLFDEYRLLLAT